MSRMRRLWPALAALGLCAATLAVWWPGVPLYDSVNQYEQATSGSYDDWHPPIMARLWSLLAQLWPGTAPMFLAQALLYWLGLALLATGLARRSRPGAAAAVLAIGAFPLTLGWIATILKDAQMAAALLAATGIVGVYRLSGRRVPSFAAAAAAVLLGYALLVRGNAAFAAIPLALALAGWLGPRRPIARGALLLGGLALAIGLSPLVNHRLLGANASGVDHVPPLYDLAGIGHFIRQPLIPGLSANAWRRSEQRGCYTPVYWDPYGDGTKCGFVSEEIGIGRRPRPVMGPWLRAVAGHPLAYAEHRLGHFAANLRLVRLPGQSGSAAPRDPEPNPDGLGAPPRPAALVLDRVAAALGETPLGAPALGLAAALAALLMAAGADPGPERDLSLALGLSAATMIGSHLVVSIASDYRYHLWSVIAGALALVFAVAARGQLARKGVRGSDPSVAQ